MKSQAKLATPLLLVAPAIAGGLGNDWIEFDRQNNRLDADPGLVLNDTQEKDFATGDLNNDGWIDLVVVRKQPFTSAGKDTNVLLMNENGDLVDRTAQFASASDVNGDNGFLTPTNDRDVAIADVNGDGWLDVITATTLSSGDPKHISHPRVYINLGMQGSTWLGLEHQDARFPQLQLGNGQNSWPRFCAVAAGDVTGDGFADLYFADYDSGGSGGGDMNDRLLINDGNGFFTDDSSSRMSDLMLNSNFGASAEIVDMNGDGANDVVKDSGLTAFVRINYNNASNEGFFNLTDVPFDAAPYFTATGDLNQDGKLDLAIADDGADRFLLNEGNDALGRVEFGAAQTFDFASGGDDGFGGNVIIEDLDNDGWNEVLITDVDVDISGCSRRTHIYHNLGGQIGGDVTLFEEAESNGSGGWKGVVGMTSSRLSGTHDIAVFDLDNDGDNDMVFGRCSGTDVWINLLDPANPIGTNYCNTAANSAGAGALIAAEGSTSVSVGNVTLSATGLPPTQPGIFFFGPNQTQNAFGDGFLCVGGSITRIEPAAFSNAGGETSLSLDFGATYANPITAGASLNFQFWYRDPSAGGAGFNLSDGTEITFQP